MVSQKSCNFIYDEAIYIKNMQKIILEQMVSIQNRVNTNFGGKNFIKERARQERS